ncbi:MAG: PQQ-binding-like beta-propeller repeat protein [Alphaproteobacteria bacterium]|nr:PQQ-binding-like beta-propeller repeat protein [Alphaproteobacteria bacterium]
MSACSSSKNAKDADIGKRVSVLKADNKKIVADKDIQDVKLNLPSPVNGKNWPQVGGGSEHNIQNFALGKQIKESWHSHIGAGSGGDYRLLAMPVVNAGKIYTIDSEGVVSAFRTDDGERLWRTDTTPEDCEDESMGGGIGFSDGVVFATTGVGEAVALNANTGAIIWHKSMSKPLRSAPTIADGRVYVVTIDNELFALDVKNGNELWRHNGIIESATLMGSSSPAVSGDSVIIAYSSGEIFSLRAQNGRVAWSDMLASSTKVGALPAIADIRGLPVVDRGRVFAVSHSGRMASIDKRTGERIWDTEIGGINTPAVAGDAVFVLTNDNELVALTRDNGRVLWSKELSKFKDPEDHDSKPVMWYGPLMAGGSLWATNSLGYLTSFNPDNGEQQEEIDIGKITFIPPTVADNTLYVVTDSGRLIALR